MNICKIFSFYHLNPHLSLIYKNQMKDEDKVKERNKLLPLIPKIIFDKLALITREKGSIKNEEDVLEWREKLTIDWV